MGAQQASDRDRLTPTLLFILAPGIIIVIIIFVIIVIVIIIIVIIIFVIIIFVIIIFVIIIIVIIVIGMLALSGALALQLFDKLFFHFYFQRRSWSFQQCNADQHITQLTQQTNTIQIQQQCALLYHFIINICFTITNIVFLTTKWINLEWRVFVMSWLETGEDRREVTIIWFRLFTFFPFPF